MLNFKVIETKRGHDNDHYLGSLKVVTNEGGFVCNLQQGVGHCCGVTFMGGMSYYHLSTTENVKEFLDWLRSYRKDRNTLGQNAWMIQNLYFYLSKETAYFDVNLRKAGVKVHEFSNRAGSENNPSCVELWYIEL